MTRYIPPPTRLVHAKPKPDLYEQAARASWIAPLIAIALNCLGRSTSPKDAAKMDLIIGFVNCGLIAAGCVLGILAMTGVKKRGPERVLAPAILGLIINGLLVVLALAFLPAAKRVADTKRRQAQMANIQQQSEDVIAKFPGWFGVARTDGGAAVVIAQWNNDAPGTAMMKQNFAADFTLLSVVVDNSNGSAAVTVDPAATQALLAGGTKLAALPPAQILNTAKEDKEQLTQRHAKPRSGAAGE